MSDEFWKWLLGIVVSTGLISAIAYIMRDIISKFFTKAVEFRFEKKLEVFKTSIRDNERELDQIRSFLATARRDRDSAIQLKRLEAAEILLRARRALFQQFSMLVEYMKILNTERILKNDNDPKISEFINMLVKPFNIDENIELFKTIDKTIPQLYLSDKSLKAFDAYESIVLNATVMMKLLCMPSSDKNRFIEIGNLSKKIIELVPSSKEGFEQFGEGYAYYWSTYFYDEILRTLRYELSGEDDMIRNAESAERLALDARKAQANIHLFLEQVGLPDNLIKSPESVAETSFAAEKASE